jgi:3-phenylpropionate/cinnamic acid dioxygenase small subunit
MTMPSATQITNLLHRYAECIDTGDFEGAAALFSRARILVAPEPRPGSDGTIGAEQLLALWKRFIVLYDDGTPRTRHVVTNAILDIDEANGIATARTYYSVYQQTEDLPLQLIVGGRYHDRFARDGETWHFSYRDYTLIDFVGDLSHHDSSGRDHTSRRAPGAAP